MELTYILDAKSVRAGLKASSKKRLLQELAEIAEAEHGLNSGAVFDAVQERELLGPTGMGGGVAIPHARLEAVDKVIGIFATVAKPIDFDAVDQQPVDLVFLLLAPQEAGAEHLRALARVSRTLRNGDVCAKLRSTNDLSAIYSILTEAEASRAA
jgi:PTS system nitrogen regulatory IIA component